MLLGAWAPGASGTAAAQFTGTLYAGPGDTPGEQPLKFTYRMAARVRRPGGSGWLMGTLANRDTRPHRVTLTAGHDSEQGLRGAEFVTELAAGGSIDVLLPVLASSGAYDTVSLHGAGDSDDRRIDTKSNANLGLLVIADSWRSTDLADALNAAASQHMRPTHASPAEEADVVPAAWLPPRWTLLSGFDVLLLDSALDAGQQRVIVDAVSAGATLLVTEHALGAQPAGPLQARLENLPADRQLWWGFGSASLVEGSELPTAAQLLSLLQAGPAGTRVASVGRAREHDRGPFTITKGRGSPVTVSGIPFPALLLPLHLTSLIALPRGIFALVVIAYVVALAWLLVRQLRRRTPLRLLKLLPLTGGVLTAVVLIGGLAIEGLALRGVSRSLALLDQEAHEAVVIGGRTLYAGTGSSSGRPQPGTFVVPLAALGDEAGGLRIHASDGGRLGAGLVRARTPVSLALSSVGPARERLLVRAEADGRLMLVAEDGFRPRPGSATVVRLPDGRGFVADDAGRLRPVDDESLARASQDLLAQFRDVPLLLNTSLAGTHALRAGAVALPVGVDLRPDAAQKQLSVSLGADWLQGPPPGCYLARMERGTLLDDLGLDIDEEAQGVHLVAGRFAPGDVP